MEAVRSRVREFGQFGRPDLSYAALREATSPEIDLSKPAHRGALHRWLNAWGCRIRTARTGEIDPFDVAIASWWMLQRDSLRAIDRPMVQLSDDELRTLGAAYDSLSASIVAYDKTGKARSMGPTAAAKTLYALKPNSVMPWDLAIAAQLHGARDRAAFTNHLALGRCWAKSLLAESGLDEPQLVAELGCPGSSLAKVLDEYCYVRYTLGH